MFNLIEDNPVLDVEISIDNQAYLVPSNMTVAAAALFVGLDSVRETPVSGAKKAPFCMMGVCYECLMTIDGEANQRGCQVVVRPGMAIERQIGPSLVEAEYYEA
jgi:succinate dehydrogenase/fumarate reductase-like Fe-S protein